MALPSNTVKVDTIKLARLTFGIDRAFSQQELRVEVETHVQRELERVVYKFRTEVLAHRLDTARHLLQIRVPATAWDYVKRDWLPTFTRWFKWKVWERVHAKEIFVEDFHTFPEATVRYPSDLGQVVLKQIVHDDIDSWVRET